MDMQVTDNTVVFQAEHYMAVLVDTMIILKACQKGRSLHFGIHINMIKNASTDSLEFNVKDSTKKFIQMQITFKTNSTGFLISGTEIKRMSPSSSTTCGFIDLTNQIIDLTGCYNVSLVGVTVPNALTITKVETNILKFKILVT